MYDLSIKSKQHHRNSMLQSKQTSRDDRRSKVSVNIDDIGSNKIKKDIIVMIIRDICETFIGF